MTASVVRPDSEARPHTALRILWVNATLGGSVLATVLLLVFDFSSPIVARVYGTMTTIGVVGIPYLVVTALIGYSSSRIVRQHRRTALARGWIAVAVGCVPGVLVALALMAEATGWLTYFVDDDGPGHAVLSVVGYLLCVLLFVAIVAFVVIVGAPSEGRRDRVVSVVAITVPATMLALFICVAVDIL